MGKSKYVVEYSCAECGNKFDKLSELDGHYEKKHKERRERMVSCEHCDYQSNRKHDVTRHTQSRHPEKCRLEESRPHTGDDMRKRNSPGTSTKTNPPKVRRTDNTWPTLDSLLGSPTKNLDGQEKVETSEKTRAAPPTPYVTPKRQLHTSPKSTNNPDVEQSNAESLVIPSSSTGTVLNSPKPDVEVDDAEPETGGHLVQRTTTTVNPDGSVKVVVEKFLGS
ncbi:hypothetical protein HOLleu_26008 [Holothuria leucospilota]|uniref:C2H2-type domain-containing protein n=1 Tax=Holothuria leucospilota TaxID=206669 RepID=A0A9Q1H4S3_HOLLE|nr:hypothetical protein HOLleu_26008 [Holothuria leucospilota]